MHDDDDLELKPPAGPEPSRWERLERTWPQWAAMASATAVAVYYLASGRTHIPAILMASGMFGALAYWFFRSFRKTADNLHAVRTAHRRSWDFRLGMLLGAAGWFAMGNELPTNRQELLTLLWLVGWMAGGGFGLEALVGLGRRLRPPQEEKGG